MNIMPLPVAASSHGLTAALAWSATPTSEPCLRRKQEFQDPAVTLSGRTEQITVPKFPRPRQNTELCDDLFCRGEERSHLSNTPSRRITDERDTGFHWALRRGGLMYLRYFEAKKAEAADPRALLKTRRLVMSL